MMEEQGERLALNDEFLIHMGLFHGSWAQADLTTDFAISKFLKVTPEEGHLITQGMMFGRKAQLLAQLISRSEHPKKSDLLQAFNAIRASKRDVFVHGHLRSGPNTVLFVERPGGGEFRAKQHRFTLEEFIDHVSAFHKASERFYDLLEAKEGEFEAFADAVFKVNPKDVADLD